MAVAWRAAHDRLATYGENRSDGGSKPGDVGIPIFRKMKSSCGEEVRDAGQIGPALQCAREAIAETNKCPVVKIWIDPNDHAPRAKAQTMYR